MRAATRIDLLPGLSAWPAKRVAAILDVAAPPAPRPLGGRKGRDGRPVTRPPQSRIYVEAAEPPKE